MRKINSNSNRTQKVSKRILQILKNDLTFEDPRVPQVICTTCRLASMAKSMGCENVKLQTLFSKSG
jgi:hypothetical protein